MSAWPEHARLGRTLKKWREALLAYFDTDRSSNGGIWGYLPLAGAAINGLIELHRRIARGFRKPQELPAGLPQMMSTRGRGCGR